MQHASITLPHLLICCFCCLVLFKTSIFLFLHKDYIFPLEILVSQLLLPFPTLVNLIFFSCQRFECSVNVRLFSAELKYNDHNFFRVMDWSYISQWRNNESATVLYERNYIFWLFRSGHGDILSAFVMLPSICCNAFLTMNNLPMHERTSESSNFTDALRTN